MNHATETKKLNNNGFSLVELIIVVAIMAVLVGVLAPQYLQYVEKSRYQTDITMMDEVKGAIEVALATDEAVYAETIKTPITVTFSSTALTSVGGTKLDAAIKKVIDINNTKLTSSTCTNAAVTCTITTTADGTVVLKAPAEANSTTVITK